MARLRRAPIVRRAAVASAGAVVVLLLLGSVGLAPRADAHALLASSSPAAGTVVVAPPTEVTLTFTEPPDPRLSSVQVLDSSGRLHVAGPVAATTVGGQTLAVLVTGLADGTYTVAWRTVSSVDGHAAAGSFAFSVGSAAAPSPAAASATGSSAVSAESIVARTAMYLGLIGLLGALFVTELAARRRGRRLMALALGAWALAAVGAVGVLLAGAADAGVSLDGALGSSLGTASLARIVPILFAGPPLLIARRPSSRHGFALGAAAVLVLVALLADAVASHAATTLFAPVNIALQWVHGLAVALWLGGLAGLLMELGDPDAVERSALVGRFSRVATVGLVLVSATGVVRAAFELHSVDELATTDYGRLLVAKTALLGVLAFLGAVNHFRHVPAGERHLGSLRRVGSAELLVGAVVVGIASALVTTAPPAYSVVSAASPSPGLTVDGSDYATTVRIRLAVTPGTAGPDTFRASLTDYDTGAPSAATSVSLRFSFPARPDIGDSTLALSAAGSGVFVGSGPNLSLAGEWTVTALVVEPGNAVEVPLVVAVAAPPQRVDVNRAPGQPTLYTVHLASGDSVQVYLDQWAAGAADLHVTYFDPSGTELPATAISATVALSGQAPAPVAMSLLEPGHAVGHLRTMAGVALSIVLTAQAPSGSPLVASLTVTPGR